MISFTILNYELLLHLHQLLLIILLRLLSVLHECISSMQSIILTITLRSEFLLWISTYTLLLGNHFLSFCFGWTARWCILSTCIYWGELRSLMVKIHNWLATTDLVRMRIWMMHILMTACMELLRWVISNIHSNSSSGDPIWNISFTATSNDYFWTMRFKMIEVMSCPIIIVIERWLKTRLQ